MDLNGPGVYEPECSAALVATESELTLLIVVHGNRGNGFSAAATDPQLLVTIPELLRNVAGEIEKQIKAPGNGGGNDGS